MSFNTKLILIQIIFMHTFLCFDLWTPTASVHVASASLRTHCHRTRSQNLVMCDRYFVMVVTVNFSK